MTSWYEHIAVGAGGIGAVAAYWLARRGSGPVPGLEHAVLAATGLLAVLTPPAQPIHPAAARPAGQPAGSAALDKTLIHGQGSRLSRRMRP